MEIMINYLACVCLIKLLKKILKNNLTKQAEFHNTTSLIGLQSSGVAIQAEGLPCAKDCLDSKEEDITPNGEVLGTKKE